MEEDLADRYRLLLELMPDGVVVHQDGTIVYANASTGRLVATTAASMIGRPVVDFIHWDSRAALLERIAALTVPGVPSQPARLQLLRADGGVTTIESVSVRTTWKGRPAMQAIMRDLTDQLAAESSLRYQAALVRYVSNAIIATDRSGRVTSWNPAAEAIFGLSADQVVGRAVGELMGAELEPSHVLASAGRHETRVRRRDDVLLNVRATAARLSEDDGYVLLCSDETAQRAAEERFTTVFRSLDLGLILVDELGTIQSANPAAARLLEDREAALAGRSITAIPLYGEDGEPRIFDVGPAFEAFGPESFEAGVLQPPSFDPEALPLETLGGGSGRIYGFDRRDGSRAWFATNIRPLSGIGSARTAVISLNDVSERRRAVQELHHAAHHDALTGLPNRALVLMELAAALGVAREAGHHVAVLFVDLDNFKLINDSLGHDVGDVTLRIVAERIGEVIRDSDVVARLGGDEFVVVATIKRAEQVRILADRLMKALAEPLEGRLHGLMIRASIGIVTAASDDPRRPSELIRDADAAMYEAKARGRNKVAHFDEALHDSLVRRLRLEAELRDALHTDAVWVAYQPIVDLSTGRWAKAEALVRWDHPELGPISPLEFIGIAEQSDLIHAIGRKVLDTACRDVKVMRERGVPDLVISVNLSLRQVDDPAMADLVAETLTRHGLGPDALCLEVTESALAEDEVNATAVLEAIRQLGVTLAIDDFGTGYSSLARLLQLKVNELKIDRSFVSRLPVEPANRLVVAGIISLAHALGLHVVAEGVETQAHLDALNELGCDYGQGYLFARPAPLAEYGEGRG